MQTAKITASQSVMGDPFTSSPESSTVSGSRANFMAVEINGPGSDNTETISRLYGIIVKCGRLAERPDGKHEWTTTQAVSKV
jgi:hypothetical protein